MERVDLIFKSVLMVFGTFFSMLVEGFGVVFTILIIMQAADYITGLIVGATTDGLKSSTGFKGLAKKMYVIILVGLAYLLEINVFGTSHLGDGICIAYIGMELISITENGGKLGIWMPPQVSNMIETLKGKENENGNKEA